MFLRNVLQRILLREFRWQILANGLGFNKDGLPGVNISGVYERFQGCKLFRDNTLNYGEVEMR